MTSTPGPVLHDSTTSHVTEDDTVTQFAVRLSSTVIEDLRGSQAWADVDADKLASAEHPADLSLVRKIKRVKRRADGSVTLDLTDEEVEALYLRAGWLVDKSRDNVGDDPTALGELN